MKEYEIVVTYLNGCAGAAYPQRTFDEAELADTDEYVRAKHGKEFEKFQKEILPSGHILYTYRSGVTYIYEFTEL